MHDRCGLHAEGLLREHGTERGAPHARRLVARMTDAEDRRLGGRVPAAHAHLAHLPRAGEPRRERHEVLLVGEGRDRGEIVRGAPEEQLLVHHPHFVPDPPRAIEQEVDVADVGLQQIAVNDARILHVRGELQVLGDLLRYLAVLHRIERACAAPAPQPVQAVEPLHHERRCVVVRIFGAKASDLTHDQGVVIPLVADLHLEHAAGSQQRGIVPLEALIVRVERVEGDLEAVAAFHVLGHDDVQHVGAEIHRQLRIIDEDARLRYGAVAGGHRSIQPGDGEDLAGDELPRVGDVVPDRDGPPDARILIEQTS